MAYLIPSKNIRYWSRLITFLHGLVKPTHVYESQSAAALFYLRKYESFLKRRVLGCPIHVYGWAGGCRPFFCVFKEAPFLESGCFWQKLMIFVNMCQYLGNIGNPNPCLLVPVGLRFCFCFFGHENHMFQLVFFSHFWSIFGQHGSIFVEYL